MKINQMLTISEVWQVVRGFILLMGCALMIQGCFSTKNTETGQELKPPAPTTPHMYYTGYTKQYVPYREKLAKGDVPAIQQMLLEEEEKITKGEVDEEKLASKLRLVGVMERASMSLQLGEPEKTLRFCQMGQELIEERESESILKGGLIKIAGTIGDVFGGGQYARYNAPGYEKVMLLDLAAMAYLLNGDERAFNVARLAIEWQDSEKEKFQEEITKLKKKEEKEIQEERKKSERGRHNVNNFLSLLNEEYAKYDDSALKVPNAFVNPFGDYMTGMVNEFKSIKLKSLLSNAHIAYKQALELNPHSAVLKKAVKDTKAKKNARRLIHVVALESFVPEKKVLSIPVDPLLGLDIEVPTYNPVKSKVSKIKVLTSKNKTLATLSLVADVEALALRQQKDRLPYVQSMLVTSIVRDTMIIAGAKGLEEKIGLPVGNFVIDLTDKLQEPDTTCWLTLPSKVLAARIYPPKGLKTLKIRSYNKAGKKLAEQKIKLSEGGQHFVLVRSIDNAMYAYPSKKIWSPRS